MKDWQPANEAERAMLLAASADDRQAYFQIIAVADLYLPQVFGDESAEQRFLTVHAFDQVFLPVFTSVEALAGQFGHAINGYTETTYSELRRKWPNPDWRLAINPGTPVDAYLPIESVEDAATGDVTLPTMAELYVESAEEHVQDEMLRKVQQEANHPDDPAVALTAASRAGDVYGYLERLLDGTVLVPTNRAAAPEEIAGDDFPWVYGVDGMIEVFTRAHPVTSPHVELPVSLALALWPEGYGLRVDPGSGEGFELPADQVLTLLAFTSAHSPPGPE